ncbi:sigma-70 family RNA polymerase sigma factor [Pseudomonas sp. P1B16]|uniref:Sigma-70 family RNA polymerase sigma factor n=1 Tax=Pseudomonas capeferrum TaxID=1495066 RepID=A0ABY7R323_9PSED|nr:MULTISPECIES: sigma-70 family RNA polymerase sigma factor [Pseudomonas]KEY88900.1 RNA polymerase sigma factor [Pseudomonas capeferrum]KGI92814.1 RNA polymerase sigma factor [Pseudomonas sp. H2]MBC3504568.1 sigma-70 family RNA polymerase sigma factor [Pseudomonas sp. SWRI59]MBC3508183.1 sigma-70 family RNA polymerase sigma factor [Pseudomonas sp. SWRI68]MCH7300818.1 sigma-70 family RNA polymerase sigma factor [Pseudomonas capeferrum]
MNLPVTPFDFQACLAACAQGDRRALQALYTHEGARLLGVTRRIARDDATAEDIVHDAFIRIWTRAASFDPARGSARGWIYSITRHLALNHIRDVRCEVAFDESDIDAIGAVFPGADDEAWSGSSRIYRCLEQLQPSPQRCILHAYVDGCSHIEIASLLDAPLGTVKAWIKRSLKALRECMG